MPSFSTVTQRTKLAVRRAPHWQKISTGGYVGFRKTAKGGTWHARYYGGDYSKLVYHSLGDLADYADHARYARAVELAREWISHVGMGGSHDRVTVRDACQHYIAEKQRSDGKAKALSEAHRLARLVFYDGSRIADIPLLKLSHRQIADWRRELEEQPALVTRNKNGKAKTRKRSAATINRDIVPLRAALNLALENGDVLTDVAWRKALKPIKNADGRRELYLDRRERIALLDQLYGDILAFVRGLTLLPLRPGALAKLKIQDYDARKHELRVASDKAGKDRRLLLPPDTNQFLRRLVRQRGPTEPIFARADGKHWDKDSWKKPIKVAVERSELPAGTTAYTLRHSTITDLVTGGLDLLTVAQVSGTSAAMIERHYGHLQKHKAASALAGLTL